MDKGILCKVNGGNFYVLANNQMYVCKASSKLKDNNNILLAGDNVGFEVLENNKGYIKEIYKRDNMLIRPPVANIDQALIITSLKEPDFSSLLLDKLILQVLDNDIVPIIYFSKIDKVNDLSMYQKYASYYESIGIKCYFGNSLDSETTKILKQIFANKKTILTGQSGVGKSTLLNSLDSSLNRETNEISFSLGRGKHTTREVEFLNVFEGLVADTPGFSSFNIRMEKTRLASIYQGFTSFCDCKYRGCLHDLEIGCKIKEEVKEGKILKESYDNYLKILNDLKRGGKQ